MILDTKKGLTLLELMLAIGMLMVIATMLFPIFGGFFRQSELENNTKQMLSVLRKAQQFSQSQEQNDEWIVELRNINDGDYFLLYPSSTPTQTETFYLPSSVGFTNDTVPLYSVTSTLYIKFKKFTGQGYYATTTPPSFVNETKTFSLALKNNPSSTQTIEVGKEGKIAKSGGGGVAPPVNEKRGAASTYYEYSSSSCNPSAWCAMIDYGASCVEYSGEITFDLINLAGKTVSAAKVCAYRSSAIGAGNATQYIEKLSSSVCNAAPSISAPPSPPALIGSGSVPDSPAAWYCIDLTSSEVSVGSNFFIRWWGQDLNCTTSPYRCFTGPASGLASCGGSKPSGVSDCRPYLDITYN